MRPARTWLGILLLVVSHPASALACAPCAAGDPTIALVSAPRPRAGLVRGAVSVRFSWFRAGTVEVSERRALASLAWAPDERVMLSAAVPFGWRDTVYANGGRDSALGLGDAELAVRVVLARDRAYAPEHLLVGLLACGLPTTIALRGADGLLLPTEAQPGRGALEPSITLLWAWQVADLTSLASIALASPLIGIGGEQAGASVRASWVGQWQPSVDLALLLGIDVRADASATHDGVALPDAPGVISSITAGVALRASGDALLGVLVRVPIAQAHHGDFSEGASLELSVIVDG